MTSTVPNSAELKIRVIMGIVTSPTNCANEPPSPYIKISPVILGKMFMIFWKNSFLKIESILHPRGIPNKIIYIKEAYGYHYFISAVEKKFSAIPLIPNTAPQLFLLQIVPAKPDPRMGDRQIGLD